jgi:hypothetical protein
MNMISTGTFQNEMDASNKQSTIAKKFAAVWEKKNAKAARAGGVSLMALSLAACGSDDTTTATTTTTTTTATTTTATTTVAADTIALTAGIDAATGGAGATTINALTNGHLEASDSITGGDGADKLVIRDYDASAGTFTMSGVETLDINFATTAMTLDLEDVTGLTSLIVDTAVATVTVANAEDTHALTLANIATATTANIDFTDAEFDGTNTYSVTLDDVDAATSLSLDTFGTSVEAIETLTIDTGTNANTGVITLTDEGANAETITITGSAAAKFSGMTSGTVNAAAATGALTLTMGAEETSVTGGTANDYIDMAGTLTYEDTVNGGAGTNTLGLSTASGAMIDNDATTGNAINVTNIQTLRLTAELTAAGTIDMSDITGLVTIDYDDIGDSLAADAHVITKAPDNLTILLGDADSDHDSAAEADATLAIGYATNSSSNNLTLTLEGVGLAAMSSSDNFIDAVTINSNGHANILEDISAFTAKSITATGAFALDVNDAALATSTSTFDASAMTAAVAVTASTTATEITGGSGGDTLTGGSSADIISGGAGTDSINGMGGIDTITLGAGVDQLHYEVVAVDIIKDFTAGAAGDQIDIDEAALDAANAVIASTTLDLVEIFDNNSVGAGTASIQILEGQEAAADAKNIFLIDLAGVTYANAAAAVDAMESGGAAQLSFAGNIAQDDGFMFGYERTAGGIGLAFANFAAADNNSTSGVAATGAANLESADLMVLEGITDISTLVAANFDFVA